MITLAEVPPPSAVVEDDRDLARLLSYRKHYTRVAESARKAYLAALDELARVERDIIAAERLPRLVEYVAADVGR